jgi:hypothetical protein
MKLKIVNTLAYILVPIIMFSSMAWGQDKEDKETFVRTGTVAFSKKYILADDLSHIVFKIKNHNPKTLSQIFGWVYRTPATKDTDIQNSKKLILVNNPHRGGIIVKGNPHRPGNKAQWRFMLDRNMQGATEKDTFTLRVSPKGVFFPSLEPPPLYPPNKKKKEK